MKQSYLAICASLVCCLAPLCVQAAEKRAINVIAEGEVLAKPDALEMDVQASASAELAETSRLSSDELKQIPVRVMLRVVFELVSVPDKSRRVLEK